MVHAYSIFSGRALCRSCPPQYSAQDLGHKCIFRDSSLSVDNHPRFQVLNRIAIEELEAWFFGDVQALNQAYPKTPKTLGHKSRYKDPDSIKGGTWESMERELKDRDILLEVCAK